MPTVGQGARGTAADPETKPKVDPERDTVVVHLKKVPLDVQVMELRARLIRIEEFLKTKYIF